MLPVLRSDAYLDGTKCLGGWQGGFVEDWGAGACLSWSAWQEVARVLLDANANIEAKGDKGKSLSRLFEKQ